jgi:hypothetical protein
MKKTLAIATVASLVLAATALYAREDHRPYRDAKIPECNDCHAGSSVPPNHVAGWNSEHRLFSVRPDANCADCHEEAFCQDCHYGGGVYANSDLNRPTAKRTPDFMPRYHRSSFLEVHPIYSFDNPASCQRCHPTQFCQECHARFRPEDLAIVSHRRSFSDLQLKPGGQVHGNLPPATCQTCHPNSVLPKHEWTSQHAREARRNLMACQTCHPDGQTCLKCHSARTGLRVNPHPDNWGSINGNLNRAAGQRTCAKCH